VSKRKLWYIAKVFFQIELTWWKCHRKGTILTKRRSTAEWHRRYLLKLNELRSEGEKDFYLDETRKAAAWHLMNAGRQVKWRESFTARKRMQMCNEWRNMSFHRGVTIREVPKFLESSLGLAQNNLIDTRHKRRIETKSQFILFCCRWIAG